MSEAPTSRRIATTATWNQVRVSLTYFRVRHFQASKPSLTGSVAEMMLPKKLAWLKSQPYDDIKRRQTAAVRKVVTTYDMCKTIMPKLHQRSLSSPAKSRTAKLTMPASERNKMWMIRIWCWVNLSYQVTPRRGFATQISWKRGPSYWKRNRRWAQGEKRTRLSF